MKKCIIYFIYIFLLVTIIYLEVNIYLYKDSYYINFYNLFGKYKSELENERILENGLNIDNNIESKDIRQLKINYTEGYGYLITYKYTNRKESHSEWVNDHNMYIEYITSNGGYDGPLIYNKFFNIIKYIIYTILTIPFIKILFNIFKYKKH